MMTKNKSVLQHRLNRRQFIKAAFGLAITGTATAACGASYVGTIEPGWLAVERVPIVLPNLPSRMTPLTIAQLSDFHLGPFTTLEQIWQAVEITNGLSPDLIVLSGDYITGDYKVGDHEMLARAIMDPLSALEAPGGVVGVLGNHDYWSNGNVLRSLLHDIGVKLLNNEALEILSGLWLVGLESMWGRRHNLDLAMRDVREAADVREIILIVHEPDYADRAVHSGIRLQLSGHSHGGQVRIPGVGALLLPNMGRRYPIGLQRVTDDMQVYTNRGIGAWPLPYRFNCRPEVTLFEITGPS